MAARSVERALALGIVLLLLLLLTRTPPGPRSLPGPVALVPPPRGPAERAPHHPEPETVPRGRTPDDLDPAVEAEARSPELGHRDITAHAAGASQVTAVLMSYPGSTRHHRLQQIVAAALSAPWRPYIRGLVLVWNGRLAQLPPAVHEALLAAGTASVDEPEAGGGPVAAVRRYGRHTTLLAMHANRVDNRWRIGPYLPTAAALNMDDDIDLHVDGVRCLVDTWRALRPLTVVAIDVRAIFEHQRRGPFGPYGYAARDTTGGVKRYSIALPRTLIVHRAHMLRYDALWREKQSAVRAVVDELLCDDIAMNFAVANGTAGGDGAGSVVYVKARYRPFKESQGDDAMFKKPGMQAMRQKCVNRLASAFGRVPLVPRRWHVLCSVDG